MATNTLQKTDPGSQPEAETRQSARRFRFTVAYDGTGYRGWQYQPEGPTVQGLLEKCLGEILQEEVRVTGAGRTDAGVHALGQVAHFDTFSRLAEATLERALNAKLPAEVRVRELACVPLDFHARYQAQWKSYRYGLADPGLPEAPLLTRFFWLRPVHLDLERLGRLAASVIGEHDFTTFSRQEGHRENRLCHVYSALWTEGHGKLYFQLRGDRFLRAMVRMLVGGMLAVADGRAGEEDFSLALAMPCRWLRAVPAPACGLTLMEVHYPGPE